MPVKVQVLGDTTVKYGVHSEDGTFLFSREIALPDTQGRPLKDYLEDLEKSGVPAGSSNPLHVSPLPIQKILMHGHEDVFEEIESRARVSDSNLAAVASRINSIRFALGGLKDDIAELSAKAFALKDEQAKLSQSIVEEARIARQQEQELGSRINSLSRQMGELREQVDDRLDGIRKEVQQVASESRREVQRLEAEGRLSKLERAEESLRLANLEAHVAELLADDSAAQLSTRIDDIESVSRMDGAKTGTKWEIMSIRSQGGSKRAILKEVSE